MHEPEVFVVRFGPGAQRKIRLQTVSRCHTAAAWGEVGWSRAGSLGLAVSWAQKPVSPYAARGHRDIPNERSIDSRNLKAIV
jgi:hypothetical protein